LDQWEELTKTQSQDYGSKCAALLAKYDPVTHSLRTRQILLFSEEQELLQTLPKWGMIVDGALWAQTPPGFYINEPDVGWLPTPMKSDYKGCRKPGKRKTKTGKIQCYGETLSDYCARMEEEAGRPRNGKVNPVYAEWLMGWPEEWTGLKPLATGKFQQWLRLHGKF